MKAVTEGKIWCVRSVVVASVFSLVGNASVIVVFGRHGQRRKHQVAGQGDVDVVVVAGSAV